MSMKFNFSKGHIELNLENGTVSSIGYCGVEICAKQSPIFNVRLTEKGGQIVDVSSVEAKSVLVKQDGFSAVYSQFSEDISVTVSFEKTDKGLNTRFSVENNTDKIVEHVEILPIVLKPFVKNGGIGKMLYPYNEGVLVDDDDLRAPCHLQHLEPEYPSQGSFGIFPNMVQSQFLAYLFDGHGLYVGAHDEKRGLKAIDYYAVDEQKNIKIEIRLYSGKGYGENFAIDYDMVYEFFDGDWYDGADIYKKWFYEHLPLGLKKVRENAELPDWYSDFPLILTYPVRGYHDMDEMSPNELFPYINAMPFVDKFSKQTGAKIMVLLMHWEGTAPWAPPYVYPPFGGEEEFDKFFNALKEKGHLLGVYCSGFSYTEQSNVLPSYDCKEILKDKETFKAFCAGRDGKVVHSKICTGQRVGYDLCIASDKGREILDEAYNPLFAKKLDYVQILDQNHGGGQYFCYSNEHNHPPCVGPWMTEEMQKLLRDWNVRADGTLLGCESASSEAFLPNLLFSDNRFELNHFIGKAVPLYAYLYHEFLHNFMGNQVCSLFGGDSFLYRLAYSFSAGDMPTIVLSPRGVLLSYWGQRDLEDLPNEESVLTFIKNAREIYLSNLKFTCYGNMIKPLPYKTGEVSFRNDLYGRSYVTEDVLTSAYEYDGEKIQIFINFNEEDKIIEFRGEKITVKALSSIKLDI